MEVKDWKLKQEVERVLRDAPSYGHKRIARTLGINKKRALRVMKLYGIKPYRRRAKKRFRRAQKEESSFENLLLNVTPSYPNHIWACDFTYLKYDNQWIYVATVLDLYSRKIVGLTVSTRHNTQLTMNCLLSALTDHSPPQIIHSDRGREYTAKDFSILCANAGITQSMSNKGCPWENGYQESFYGKFKVDLGDPSRFESLGELVYEIYLTVHTYNSVRIHTALRMSPMQFLEKNEVQLVQT